jgi:hypothetical protein
MRINAMAYHSRKSLAWSGVFLPAGLAVCGLVVWLWFISPDHSARRADWSVPVLVLVAPVGVTWFRTRARAKRRWRTVWNRYAELDEATRA